MAELKEIGVALIGWDRAGGSARVCAVRVVQREGLGSVPSGELVMRTVDDGAGVMLGGAADATVSELADAVLGGAGLRSRRVRLGEPEAVAAGLACGGTATLLAHAVAADAAALLGTALAGGEPALMAATPSGVRVLAGADLERSAGTLGAAGDAAVTERGARLLRRGVSATETLDIDGKQALLDLWVPVPRVLVVGAGALGAALQTQAAALGWQFASSAGVAETEAAVATLTAADALVLLDHSPTSTPRCWSAPAGLPSPGRWARDTPRRPGGNACVLRAPPTPTWRGCGAPLAWTSAPGLRQRPRCRSWPRCWLAEAAGHRSPLGRALAGSGRDTSIPSVGGPADRRRRRAGGARRRWHGRTGVAGGQGGRPRPG